MFEQIQYAEWKNFESAWFPRFKDTKELLSYEGKGFDDEKETIPVGFIYRDEAKDWLLANFPDKEYNLEELSEPEIFLKWYYFVKIVEDIDSSYPPSDLLRPITSSDLD